MKRIVSALAISLAVAGCATPRSTAPEGPSLAKLYSALAQHYRADSKFRTDYDPVDAPYDEQTLTRNFVQVAQRSETQVVNDVVLIKGEDIPLSRWQKPLRLWATGATSEDEIHIEALRNRVASLTGLPTTRETDPRSANVYFLIFDAAERRELIDWFRRYRAEDASPLVAAWPDQPQYPCIAQVFSDPETHSLELAMIFIKAELQGEFRKACLTEEFIQSLGLMNDADEIRPSIFNDDAEFIELTRHDEYLLEILYDERLRPGMGPEEATPIVKEIAAELLARDQS